MKRSPKHDYKEGHNVELLQGGGSFFPTVERVLDEAKHYIHFQSYIVDEDDTGKRIVSALVRAARRGVRVYLLLDAFGTKYLTRSLLMKSRIPGFFSGFSLLSSL